MENDIVRRGDLLDKLTQRPGYPRCELEASEVYELIMPAQSPRLVPCDFCVNRPPYLKPVVQCIVCPALPIDGDDDEEPD